jgi:elongation factor Tu
VTGTLELDGEAAPGARVTARVALDKPVAMEPGVRFTLREGGRTVGAGIVTETL